MEDGDYMPWPCRELGYACDQETQTEKQSKWQSTNCLMNLMESISVMEYQGQWRMRGEVIFHCYFEQQAWVGEVIWTALTGADIEQGHGLSHSEAGISVESAGKINAKYYNAWADDLWYNAGSRLQNNLAEEEQRVDDLLREEKKLDAEVERLERLTGEQQLELATLEVEYLEAKTACSKAIIEILKE